MTKVKQNTRQKGEGSGEAPGVRCNLCGAGAPAPDDPELDFWKYDAANRNTVCPACLPSYSAHWPAPRWDAPEVEFFRGGARLTRRALYKITGGKGGGEMEKILLDFLQHAGAVPIGRGERVTVHAGREVHVYYH